MSPDDKDNPFGPPPPDDPFGPPPANDPFGRPHQSDPVGGPPSGDPIGAPPENEAWRRPSTVPHDPFDAPTTSRPNADGAVPALVLGILSIFFCPLCAPFAWYFGQRAERLVDASGGVLGGRGEATAGKIIGIVMSVLMLLGIVLLIVFGVLVAAGSAS